MQETARQRIQELVAHYQTLNRNERRQYSEDDTRTNFVDPFFAALRWDMQSRQEVGRDFPIGNTRVDYAFQLNGVIRFLVEAKKLSAELTHPDYARQAIHYAYMQGIDWVVLTNFCEFKLFNVLWTTEERAYLQLNLGCEEYDRGFDELWNLSKPGFQEDLLDRRVFSANRKINLDEALFADLSRWREELLAHIRGWHGDWPREQVEATIQRVLNRLIFIRSVEDKGIQSRELLPLLRQLESRKQLDRLPHGLQALYRQLDDIYNRLLFQAHPADHYEADAKQLEEIIRGLHRSRQGNRRYDFSQIDADALGQIYEQYLTRVQAEDRKQQGIYYTPLFVVRYIVRNTVLKALAAARERGGIAAARQIRVLDPACGSGSFLIAAFDALDAWLRDHDASLQDDSERYQHILRENLYGVDLDPRAVEVAMLNLWLKAVHQRQKLPAIPNIRHGDSLIDEEFDWHKEFPQVFAAGGFDSGGGFDVVIGNPPYVRQEALTAEFKQYAREKYRSYTGRADLYVCFYERAHELLKAGGHFGFVSSNKFMRADYGKGLRRYLLETARLEEIVDMSGEKVFEQASVDSAIVLTQKRSGQVRSGQVRRHLFYAAISVHRDTRSRISTTGRGSQPVRLAA